MTERPHNLPAAPRDRPMPRLLLGLGVATVVALAGFFKGPLLSAMGSTLRKG